MKSDMSNVNVLLHSERMFEMVGGCSLMIPRFSGLEASNWISDGENEDTIQIPPVSLICPHLYFNLLCLHLHVCFTSKAYY